VEQIIGYLITLRPDVQPQDFEAFFEESARKVRENRRLMESTTLALYRRAPGSTEFLWLTRFADEELHRVSRGAIPFVLTVILGILRDVRERYAGDIAALSAPVTTPQGLVYEWNERFGRFTKLSLDSTPTD
jgi:hypothetical protein